MKKRLFILIPIFFAYSTPVFAGLPAYSDKIGRATSDLIGKKLKKRGFAANDPRYGAAMEGVGTAMTVAATGVAVGASWPLVLASVGISTAISVAVPLLMDDSVEVEFEGNDKLKISGPALQPQAPTSAPAMPSTWPAVFSEVGTGSTKYYATNTGLRLFWSFHSENLGMEKNHAPAPLCISSNGSLAASSPCPDTENSYWLRQWTQNTGTGYQYGLYEFKPGENDSIVPKYVPKLKPVPEAVQELDALPVQKKEVELSSRVLADIANSQWKHASSQPDYKGVPYDAKRPITPQEVDQWRQAKPEAVPKLKDFIAPAVNPDTTKVEIPVKNNPNETNMTKDQLKVDLGKDPGIKAPDISQTPTGVEIFAPVKNSMQGWFDFAVPAHQSQCPTGTFDFWGKTYVINAHCTLMEAKQGLISGAMIAAWAIVALFVLLGA